ncbi:hypothetical protein SO3561_10564 [Streptomyces olivochromogenes]|uniref:Uncharacterized protein n=1 Tax=Streptomyces olivochromogenes TaxID=1963 RepID=A0A286PHG0_STROL|nr:hypothetical protein SO3561_10564 [Streptomyces olivochromogenes]
MRGCAAWARPATCGPHPTDPGGPHDVHAHARREPYTLLCENSFSTGTPTLWRAREAQSRWKNSST